MKNTLAAIFISAFLFFPAQAAPEKLDAEEALGYMETLRGRLQAVLTEIRAEATPEQRARWPEHVTAELFCKYVQLSIPNVTCPPLSVPK